METISKLTPTLNIINPNLKFTIDMSKIPVIRPIYIVIHHALAKFCTVYDIHNWHLDKGWWGIGYHFFIAKNGKIYKGRDLNRKGAHVVEDKINWKSIGICVEGCYEDYVINGINQVDKEMPNEQLIALIELLMYLQETFNINDDNIKPHRYYANYKKCPGNYFPWNKMMSWELKAGIRAVNNLYSAGKLANPEIWKLKLEDTPKNYLMFTMLDRIK